MPNVTISIDEKTLKESRKYAAKHGLSLNRLIREMLAQRVSRDGAAWLDECFAQMDQLGVDSKGAGWTRDELYDV